MPIKDCTGISGVTVKQQVDDKPGNYKILIRKHRTFYQEIGDKRIWNGPNKLQEFDPETLQPIKTKPPKVNPVVEPIPETIPGSSRSQRKTQLEGINFHELRAQFGIPFERGLKKAILIERILDNEGLI